MVKARGPACKEMSHPLSPRFPDRQKPSNSYRKPPQRSPPPLRSSSCFRARRTRGKEELDSQKGKRTTNRRDRENAERGNRYAIIPVFRLLKKNSAVSAYSAVPFFPMARKNLSPGKKVDRISIWKKRRTLSSSAAGSSDEHRLPPGQEKSGGCRPPGKRHAGRRFQAKCAGGIGAIFHRNQHSILPGKFQNLDQFQEIMETELDLKGWVPFLGQHGGRMGRISE